VRRRTKQDRESDGSAGRISAPMFTASDAWEDSHDPLLPMTEETRMPITAEPRCPVARIAVNATYDESDDYSRKLIS